MIRSVCENSYGIFQPNELYFLRSYTVEWKNDKANNSFFHSYYFIFGSRYLLLREL